MTTDDSHERDRRIVEQWKNAAPALAAKRDEELRNQRYDPVVVNAVLDLGLRHAQPRTDSGLIEMQKWFRLLAEKQRKPLSIE